MIVTIYAKYGDMSTDCGMSLDVISYDDAAFGEPIVYGERITEEEYNELMEEMRRTNAKRGFEGYVNEEGYAKYLAKRAEMEREDAM